MARQSAAVAAAAAAFIFSFWMQSPQLSDITGCYSRALRPKSLPDLHVSSSCKYHRLWRVVQLGRKVKPSFEKGVSSLVTDAIVGFTDNPEKTTSNTRCERLDMAGLISLLVQSVDMPRARRTMLPNSVSRDSKQLSCNDSHDSLAGVGRSS